MFSLRKAYAGQICRLKKEILTVTADMLPALAQTDNV